MIRWMLGFVVMVASCGSAPTGSSRLGETCSNSADCLEGRCINLVCEYDPDGCSSDSACVVAIEGARCLSTRCGCKVSADCSMAISSEGERYSRCSGSTLVGACEPDPKYEYRAPFDLSGGLEAPKCPNQAGSHWGCAAGDLCVDPAGDSCKAGETTYSAYPGATGVACGSEVGNLSTDSVPAACIAGDACLSTAARTCQKR